MFQPHQVIHRNQILATGVNGRELTELVRLGAITRLWRGFYTTGAALELPDPRGVTRSMRAVLSHQSAVAWYGVDLPEAVDTLHVTAPRNRGRRSDAAPCVRIHRRDLVLSEVNDVRGVRVTDPCRTIADVARACSTAYAVAVADGFLRRRLTTMPALAAYADFLPAGPGRRKVRLVSNLVDEKADSVFESITRVLLVEAGLPVPTSQLNINDRHGAWIGRVDFAWPEARVIVECDGFEFHDTRDSFERDRRRWSELTRAGWRVIVVTWRQVMTDPAYVVGLVADLLGLPDRSSAQPGTDWVVARAS
jgi:hypothetical protein